MVALSKMTKEELEEYAAENNVQYDAEDVKTKKALYEICRDHAAENKPEGEGEKKKPGRPKGTAGAGAKKGGAAAKKGGKKKKKDESEEEEEEEPEEEPEEEGDVEVEEEAAEEEEPAPKKKGAKKK